jgi:CRISPR-associated protein Cmr3
MTVLVHFALLPRDGLFCKDGRGWHTSASGRGHALDWPWPSTVLGAIRTAWGRQEEDTKGSALGAREWREHTAEIRLGKTLALRRPHRVAWATEHRVWPVPADALWLEGKDRVYRLDPVPGHIATMGRNDDEAREALWWPRFERLEKPLHPPRWWSEADFCAWLEGKSVPIHTECQVLALQSRIQVRVRIRPEELTADEGVLFSHDVLETLDRRAEWAIGVEASLGAGRLPPLMTLGSDSRLACIEELPSGLFDPPASLLNGFGSGSKGLRLVVVTPTCFSAGWLPDGLDVHDREYRGHLQGVDGEVVLRAAFVPRPINVSGWDMAANDGRGAPKPTSRMVPPGAVYFFERCDGNLFDETAARALWLAALGQRTDEGFGRVVPGVWSPRRSLT